MRRNQTVVDGTDGLAGASVLKRIAALSLDALIMLLFLTPQIAGSFPVSLPGHDLLALAAALTFCITDFFIIQGLTGMTFGKYLVGIHLIMAGRGASRWARLAVR